MNLWNRIKVRQSVRSELHRRIELQKARIEACRRELVKIGDMKHRAYGIMWVQMLDHYQELLVLEKNAYGCNLYWILTGKRWLFKPILIRALKLAERWLG